jgi:hypothetical protein
VVRYLNLRGGCYQKTWSGVYHHGSLHPMLFQLIFRPLNTSNFGRRIDDRRRGSLTPVGDPVGLQTEDND